MAKKKKPMPKIQYITSFERIGSEKLSTHYLFKLVFVLGLICIFSIPVVEGGVQAKLVYQEMVQDAPDVVAPGERLKVIWTLENQSNVNTQDYSLIESDSNYSDSQTNYPPFTINSNQTDDVIVENFPAPDTPGYYKIYFDIIDADGIRLNPLALGSFISYTVWEPFR